MTHRILLTQPWHEYTVEDDGEIGAILEGLPVERGGYVDKGYLRMLGAPTVVVSEYAVTKRGGPEPPAWVRA